MIDAYEKAEAYVRSVFAYSNAPQEVIEAARSAYVAGFEQHMSIALEKAAADSVRVDLRQVGNTVDPSRRDR